MVQHFGTSLRCHLSYRIVIFSHLTPHFARALSLASPSSSTFCFAFHFSLPFLSLSLSGFCAVLHARLSASLYLSFSAFLHTTRAPFSYTLDSHLHCSLRTFGLYTVISRLSLFPLIVGLRSLSWITRSLYTAFSHTRWDTHYRTTHCTQDNGTPRTPATCTCHLPHTPCPCFPQGPSGTGLRFSTHISLSTG